MPKRLMIIDSLNLFIRNYVVDPSMSTNGQPLGGLKGYFKSLQKLIRDVKPDGIVIVWDVLVWCFIFKVYDIHMDVIQ